MHHNTNNPQRHLISEIVGDSCWCYNIYDNINCLTFIYTKLWMVPTKDK